MEPSPPPKRSLRLRPTAFEVFGALCGFILLIVCHLFCGPTLGLVIGALAVTTILIPLLAAAEEQPGSAWAVLFGAWGGLGAGMVTGNWPAMDYARMLVVTFSYGIALYGATALLKRLRLHQAIAGAINVVLGLLWLSWPIWLAPQLSGSSSSPLVNALVKPHPIFAVNGSMPEIFPVPWPQHRIAYRLTNIGDDVPYEMPATIAWTVLLHLALALLTTSPSWVAWACTHARGRKSTMIAMAGSPPHPPAG